MSSATCCNLSNNPDTVTFYHKTIASPTPGSTTENAALTESSDSFSSSKTSELVITLNVTHYLTMLLLAWPYHGFAMGVAAGWSWVTTPGSCWRKRKRAAGEEARRLRQQLASILTYTKSSATKSPTARAAVGRLACLPVAVSWVLGGCKRKIDILSF